MKPGIHRKLCESNAVCVALAPEVFDLDDEGIAVPLVNDLDDGQTAVTRMAVDGCPRAAVFIADDN